MCPSKTSYSRSLKVLRYMALILGKKLNKFSQERDNLSMNLCKFNYKELLTQIPCWDMEAINILTNQAHGHFETSSSNFFSDLRLW